MGVKVDTLQEFLETLRICQIHFYTGVACSILAPIIKGLEENPSLNYFPATREDLAVGMAAGAYLAGKSPCVLMQNSGLGYSLNALTSLDLIYKITALLIIGFRGAKPGDAPEHWVMGRTCTKILEAVGIPYWIPERETLISNTQDAIQTMRKGKIPVVLLIKAGVL